MLRCCIISRPTAHRDSEAMERCSGHATRRSRLRVLAACRTATVDKANDGPDNQKVAFDLKSVELHFDAETNTTTTAPVVIAAEAPINIPRGPTLNP